MSRTKRNVGIFYAYWTDTWDVDFMPFIGRVKGLGFDQLEINAGTLVGLSDHRLKSLCEEAQRNDISLSYGIGLTPDHDVSSLDETVRLAGVDFMTQMIQRVSFMGGGTIGGTIHSYWPAAGPSSMDEKRLIWQQSIKSMKELVKIAEDQNVVLAVEVINRFEQFLLNTCAEAVEYVDEIDSPACGILLDTFHMNIEEDSFGDAIRLAGRRLASFHIGETNRKPPGCGRMPWKEIKDALDDIEYDRPLVMEPFVRSGGRVGHDIAVWRDLMPGMDLDEEVRRSVTFVRSNLC